MHHAPLRSAFFALAATLLFAFAPSNANVSARQQRRASRALKIAEAVSSSAIPTPRSVLGFAPGDDRTVADWRQITNYFARLDRASERVLVQTIGETTLKRPLVVAYISAPENIRNLAKYKEVQRRLADPRAVRGDAERERLIREGKTVVVVSCSIHSTEIVASQMSMRLAYELASARDAETLEILSNTILILVPSPNPDGIDIVADWYRKTLGTPYEGAEPPELYHHYAGHDNNRDWFMLNLKETQILTRLFWKEWFPQLVYDVHQQGANGSRFFIPPFYDPPNPHIAPLLLREVGLVGHKIAADLQSAGFKGVITNALYDTWWHGGFRTAPYYHNSVGILSEAASAKLMTPANVTPEQLAKSSSRGMPSALQSATNFPDPWPGGAWRPRDIMEMELIAARSVLSLASKYRARYLRNTYDLAARALDWAPSHDRPLAYLIQAGQGVDENVAKLVGTLVAQGIEVHRLDSEIHAATLDMSELHKASAKGASATRAKSEATQGEAAHAAHTFHEIPSSSYLVFLAQPFRANVQALFERQTYPDRRATPGGEAERPYDVAGWTLPMQMGVETTAIMAIREPANERRMTLVRDVAEVRRDFGLPARHDDRSPVANPITRPVRVGLYKSFTAPMDEGWTRFVFDTFNVPYKSLPDAEVRAGNLRTRYDVIVLPSMRLKEIVEGREAQTAPKEFMGGVTEAGVENLKRFVEEGGTLLCFDAATEFAIKRFKLPLKNTLEGLKTSEFYCPGSILGLDVDTSHPFAKGLRRATDAYFVNSAAFDVNDRSDERVRVVARYAEKDLLRSGWLLGEEKLRGKVALAEVSLGKGRVVLFGFRPQHRAQTWGTFPLIFNAINSSVR